MNLDLNPIFKQLDLDPLARGLQLVRGTELAEDAFPRLDTDRPALVFDLDTRKTLRAAARTLRVNYPETHRLRVATPNRVQAVTLHALGRGPALDPGAALYVPPLENPGSPLTLANIMARLRAPNGCPWDLEQTHASLTRALIEEAYEVVEAISDEDAAQLKEELGDLWLHVLFQTQIARDASEFSLAEVGQELAAKLVRRHPHVFGDQEAKDAATVLANWEAIKQAEKKSKGQATVADALDAGIPRDLPALVRAQKVEGRARQNGSKSANGALSPRIAQNIKQKRGAARERAVGLVLLELARIAEELHIDAERALRTATRERAKKKKSEK